MTNVIAKFEGDYAFLSNFWSSPITLDLLGGKPLAFPTGEHAFQACKAKAITLGASHRDMYVHAVWKADTPSEAKYLGRSIKIDLDRWEASKVGLMRQVVFQKFTEPHLRARLLDTGHALLVEGNTWGDTFWGRCEGKGSNILGSILMEVRGYWLWSEQREHMLGYTNNESHITANA